MCTTYFGIVEDYSKIWLHLCDWFFNFSQENGCLAYESGVIATSQNLLAHGGTHQNVMCTTCWVLTARPSFCPKFLPWFLPLCSVRYLRRSQISNLNPNFPLMIVVQSRLGFLHSPFFWTPHSFSHPSLDSKNPDSTLSRTSRLSRRASRFKQNS